MAQLITMDYNRKQAENAIGGNQLGNLIRKVRPRNAVMSNERSTEITEQEMPDIRKEIPKGGAYNSHGDAERMVEIKASVDHNTVIRVHRGKFQNGKCVYMADLLIPRNASP